MLSRCPFPECLTEFAVEEAATASDRFARAICPKCKRFITARPAQLLDDLAARREARFKEESSEVAVPTCGSHSIAVVLDDIRSLHNVGATFRSADAAGFTEVYLCGITGVPPRKEIAKVSLGAEEWLPYNYRVNIVEVLVDLRRRGFTIVSLERNQESACLVTLLREGKLTKPLALVVGNEVTGVSPEAMALSDHICHLNMRGRKESLNVSVAYGVAAYFIAEGLAQLEP